MSLPPDGTSNRNMKEETYEEHVEVERLIKVTHGALLELLTQIVLKDLTPGGLHRVIKVSNKCVIMFWIMVKLRI